MNEILKKYWWVCLILGFGYFMTQLNSKDRIESIKSPKTGNIFIFKHNGNDKLPYMVSRSNQDSIYFYETNVISMSGRDFKDYNFDSSHFNFSKEISVAKEELLRQNRIATAGIPIISSSKPIK